MRTQVLKTVDGRVVCARCAIARSVVARTMGLMGRRQLAPDAGMLFPHTGSIHMFFMRFSIDAVFCDGDLRVLKVLRGLRPWRVAYVRGAKVTVELPTGGAVGIEPGDVLVLDA
jgi:uncharacterized protein